MLSLASTGNARRNRLFIVTLFVIASLILGGLPARAQRAFDPTPAASGSITIPLPQSGAPGVESAPRGDVPTFPDMVANFSPGEPQLPVAVWRILLPPDVVAQSVKVELVAPEWADLPGQYDVAAAPPLAASDLEGTPEWGGHEPEALRDGRLLAIYEQDAYWPAHPIAILSVGSQRNWRVLELAYWPLAYNPAQGTLRQITGGALRVTYQRSGAPGLALDAASGAAWDALAPSLLNPTDHSLYVDHARSAGYSLDAEGVATSATNDYVIITTAAIAANSAQLAAFVQSKQQAGHGVKVVTEGASATSTTYVSGGTVDARADNIRNWLASRYASEGIQYVLLIGKPSTDSFDSATSVPMKITYPFMSNAVATDMYYSDLSGNWNLNANDRFGELADIGAGGIDRLPEVYVGRVPFYGSYAELDSILAKFVAYQGAGGDLAWRQRALIAAAISNHGPQDNNNDGVVVYPPDYPASFRTYGDDWGQALRNVALGAGLSAYTLYEKEGVYADGSAYPLTAANAPLNTANLVGAWQQGYGIVAWWGHGNATGAYRRIWVHDDTRADHITQYSQETQTTALFTTAQVAQLNNSRPSFVLQVACTNGSPNTSTNLGYGLLVNGAVGTISSSHLSYYVLGPWPSSGTMGDNATLAYMAMDRMLNYDETIGEALAYYRANALMGSNGQLWQNMVVSNLYGDPALSLTSSGAGCAVPPPTPTSPTPSDSAGDVDPNADLAWLGGPGCEGETVTYDVYLAVNGSAETLVCSGAESSACAPGPLQEGATYTWRVVAQSSVGETQGPEWTFATQVTPCSLSPVEPNDPMPADGQTGVALDAQLSWCGGHPCEGEQVTYEVYLEANTVTTPTVLVCSNVDDARCDPGPLQEGTQYAWQVIAWGLNGPVRGPIWTFDTAVCSVPAPVSLGAPNDGAQITGGQPLQLLWQPAEGARRYQIQVAREDTFETLLANQQTDETGLTLAATMGSGAYYWRVRVVETTLGCPSVGEWSETRSFEVQSSGLSFAFLPMASRK
jgi:hypothetical protein